MRAKISRQTLRESNAVPRIIERVYHVGCGGWGGGTALARGASCNVYLIDGGSELALVDAGVPESVTDILRNIRSLGFDPQRLRKLLLTHAHWDHCAGTAEWLKQLDLQTYGHAICRETMQGKGNSGIYDVDYMPPVHFSAPVHHVVAGGSEIVVGDVAVKVIELPGHTPDGLGFLIPLNSGAACFSGDTAIGDQPCGKGIIGWIDGHWKSCLSDSKRSLSLMQSLNLSAMFPGHGVSQLGADAVRTSLINCQWRLGLLAGIPQLGSMMYIKE
jgi:hydroxyacylglutathione hydrolase